MKYCLLLSLILAVSAPAPAQDHHWHAGLSGGAAFPIRDFGELFSTGIGGQAALLYETSPGVYVLLSAGGFAWNVDNDLVNQQLRELGSTAKADLDAPLSIIPITIGGRILWPGETVRPYVGASLGVYITNFDVTGTVTDGQTVQTVSESSSFSTFALDLELGVLLPLADRLDLNLHGRYNAVSDAEAVVIPPAVTQDPVTARSLRFISLMLGLEYAL
jgi:opacity protein-like surface antigen